MGDAIVDLARDVACGIEKAPDLTTQLAANLFLQVVRESGVDEYAALGVFKRQHAKGLAKYGTGLSDCGLTRRQLLAHAAEEAADLLCYLIAAKEAPDA